MKSFSKILMIACMVAVGQVAFGCQTEHVPKEKQVKFESVHSYDCSIIVEFTAPVAYHAVICPVFAGTAVMPDATFVPSGSVVYLETKKSNYRSPNIDRKWVWWNSMITNS